MAHFFSRITFITGLILGALLAFYVQRYVILEKKSGTSAHLGPNYSHYNKWFQKRGLSRKAIPWDNMRYSNTAIYKESDFLYSHINIHCLIIVKDTANFEAILDTWAKGCNFISSITIEPRHKIMPSIQDKDKSSWVLLCKYLGRLDSTSLDWVLVVKDTTFVLLENLRQYVALLNASEPHYLGHAIKFWGIAYNSGDPGYALSKGVILLLQKQINEVRCSENSYRNKEDFYLGKYLMQLNITPVDTADEYGLSTFHPYNWYHMFYPKDNYYVNSVFPVKCCSKSSIAFQATEGSRMYTFDYLFYKLQIFTSGHYGNQPFKSSVPDDELWKKVLRDHNIKSNDISSDAYYRLWENLINDPNSFAANLKKEQFSDYDN
ncbi:glycoprotein-N-acetylgalactosamine 3-beta-galactosyltransferase 1-like isoform X2 [Euwallacea similis]|uniref:glycoprotein-N-acetylgalactosamine 3-beta-galactosyltransferase 1-like isoform X2 n=1 Tax=Euwallacea similis TaxID=1736056 RepID=UPI00344BD8BE